MPLSEKLGRPFELLSIRRHKKREDENSSGSGNGSSRGGVAYAPAHASAAYMPSTQPANPFHHPRTAPPPPPPPSSGFVPVVQYERLTPSVSQRPPVASGGVTYERLTPSTAASSSNGGGYVNHHSPNVVQYERLTPSSSAAAGGSSLGSARPPSIPSIRQNSPLDYEMRSRPAGASGASSAFVRSSPAPSLASLPSPGMLTPLVPDVAGRSPLELRPLRASASAGASPAPERASSASGSDKSTPFSAVMEEWMSQLRTPTPDVTLLPSPYDFNKDTPTPVQAGDDLKHIHSALLPTPPPDVHDQTQNPKSSEYVLNVSRRPLGDDIASLCRDLISHGGSATRQTPPHARLPSLKKFPGPSELLEADARRDGVRVRDLVAAPVDDDNDDDDDDDDDDRTSTSGAGSSAAGGGGGGGRGKRRKMCTADGCSNLSRSRGLCKAHGGGRRCSVEGCTRASQSGSLCITHGGGKRCTVEGCVKAAQSRGMCKAHGGGVRCRVDGCTKSSQGDGFCRSHGGGRRCGHPSGCSKWAQRNGMCMAHSEGRYGNSYRGRLHRMQEDGERQEL